MTVCKKYHTGWWICFYQLMFVIIKMYWVCEPQCEILHLSTFLSCLQYCLFRHIHLGIFSDLEHVDKPGFPDPLRAWWLRNIFRLIKVSYQPVMNTFHSDKLTHQACCSIMGMTRAILSGIPTWHQLSVFDSSVFMIEEVDYRLSPLKVQ